jgi:hypothetical protein
VVAFVVFMAWLLDKPIEAILFIISHIIIRARFDKQYHCGKTAICIVTTLTIACFGILSALPLSLSLLSTVPICFFVSWVGYLAQDRLDLIEYKKKSNFKDEIIRKCNDLNYNLLKTEIAIRFFVNKEKPKDVWLWLCQTQDNPMEWDSVKNLKYKMKKDLF